MKHQYITNSLFNTSQSKLVYILNATLISSVPAFVVGLLVYWLYPTAETPQFDNSFASMLLKAVILGPIFETLMLWGGISVISKFVHSTWHIALVSALCWALLHSLQVPVWGLSIFWPFVVFSIAFTEWAKVSNRDAFMVALAIHMLQNFVAICLFFLG